MFYYRGLREYEQEKGYLVDTCLNGQDMYRKWMEYFEVPQPSQENRKIFVRKKAGVFDKIPRNKK